MRNNASTIKVQSPVKNGDQTSGSTTGMTSSKFQAFQAIGKLGGGNGGGVAGGTSTGTPSNDNGTFENLASVSGSSDPCFQGNYFQKNIRECCAPGKTPFNFQMCGYICRNEPFYSQYKDICCNEASQVYNQNWCTIPDQSNQCNDPAYINDHFNTCCTDKNPDRNVEMCAAVYCSQRSEAEISGNPTIYRICCNEKASYASSMRKKCMGAYPPQFCSQTNVSQLSASDELFNLCCTGEAYTTNRKTCDLVNPEPEEERVDYCIDPRNKDAQTDPTGYSKQCCQKLTTNTPKLQIERCQSISVDQCIDRDFINKLLPKQPDTYMSRCCKNLEKTDINFDEKSKLCQKARDLLAKPEPTPSTPSNDVKVPATPTNETSKPTTTINVERSSGISNFNPEMCLDTKFQKVAEPVVYHKLCCAGLAGRRFRGKLRNHCKLVNKQIISENESFQSNRLKDFCADKKNYDPKKPTAYMERCCSKNAAAKMNEPGLFCEDVAEVVRSERANNLCKSGGLDFIMKAPKNFQLCCKGSVSIPECEEVSKIDQCMDPKVNRERFKFCCSNITHEPLKEMCQITKNRLRREKEAKAKEKEMSARSNDKCLIPEVAYDNYGKCCANGNYRASAKRGEVCKEVGAKLKSEAQKPGSSSSSSKSSSNDKCLIPEVAYENYGKCCEKR